MDLFFQFKLDQHCRVRKRGASHDSGARAIEIKAILATTKKCIKMSKGTEDKKEYNIQYLCPGYIDLHLSAKLSIMSPTVYYKSMQQQWIKLWDFCSFLVCSVMHSYSDKKYSNTRT